MYTISRCIFGWSHEEFCRSTPRMYFAVLYKFSELKGTLYAQPQKALTGKEAFQALASLAGKLR